MRDRPANTPSRKYPISVARQAQIIGVINKKLSVRPRQGFCLIGSPGTGKTYVMKAIERRVVEYHKLEMTKTRPEVYRTTLTEWQEANLESSRGEYNRLADKVSAKKIREIARSATPGTTPTYSLHLFIDEFDSQPTVSEFSSSKLQTFVNACYENAPRIRAGNETDVVQLVVAMNKSWPEFESAYGIHVARRIAEMCVRIDFDKAVITDPEPVADTSEPDAYVPDAIDQALAGWFDDNTIGWPPR